MPGGGNIHGWVEMPVIVPQFDLTGRIALITGAGSGIGRGVALALSSAGAEVVVVGRTLEKLEETRQLITELGGKAWLVRADVAQRTQVEDVVAKAVRESGGLHILVNAAGGQLRKPALEVSEEDWDSLMCVNLKAVFFCCQAAARVMSAQGGGKIINITSLTAVIGLPYLSVYGASKGGVSQLTKSLAVEWAPMGIHVNAIGPGRIRTPMTEPLFQDDVVRESFLRLIPLRRAGIPEDVAGAVVFLASDASNYITGQTLYVDGGWLSSGGNPLR